LPDTTHPDQKTGFLVRLLRPAATVADWLRLLYLRAFGANSRMVTTPHGTVHVLEMPGQGPLAPVVLIHGLSSCALDYGPLIMKLRRHCQRVITFDLPGHGYSPPPQDGMHLEPMRSIVNAAFEQIVTEPHIVYGNSLGGYVAVRMALKHPKLCKGLILVSPAGTPVTQQALQATLDRFALHDRRSTRAFVDACMANPSRYRPLLMVGVRERMARPTIRALLGNITGQNMFAPAQLASLHMPIHLFWGTDDEILDTPHFDFYRQNLPGQQGARRKSGFGHAPHVDGLKGLMGDILPFITALSTEET